MDKKNSAIQLVVCLLTVFVTSTTFAAAGRTVGKASVSSSGSAQYTIPLWVPPGTNRLTPTLALRYSSGTENGVLGIGWSIDGLSAIARCNKTIAQDLTTNAPILDVSDGYCLDGNRLRLTGGTYGTAGSTYQTEIETFSKVTAQSAAGNGPAWWEVKRKDGLIYEYGNTTNSRIETVNSPTARLWALNRIGDRSGNYIDIEYYEDTTNGSFRPKEIRYTGNATLGFSPDSKVVFVYETVTRPDPIYKYRFGINGTSIEGQINEFLRLDRIDVIDINSSTTVRTYELTYEASGGAGGRSRLSSIQECNAADCLAATTLQWINGTPSWSSTEVSAASAVPSGAVSLIGDINGDGRDDIVFSSSATSGGSTWRYMLGTATGFGAEVNTAITNWNQADAQALEWNGDGMMDVIVPCNGTGVWCVLRANGSGFTNVTTTTPSTGSSGGQALFTDIDGDGRDDLVRIMNSGQLGLRLGTGAGFAPTETVAYTITEPQTSWDGNFSDINSRRSRVRRWDFNGDGRGDFMLRTKYVDMEPGAPPVTIRMRSIFLGASTAIVAGEGTGGVAISAAVAGDFNGDGLTDIAYVLSSSVTVNMAQGSSVSNTVSGPSLSGYNSGSLIVLDYDGDGLDDFLVQKTSPATWWVSRSTGNGFTPLTDTSLGGTTFTRVADVNGDGLQDLVRIDTASGNVPKSRLHNGVYPDLLDRATDGFGMYADFNYSSLTAGSPTYTKGSGATYPTIEYQAPMYVVSNYTATAGNLGTYTMTYTYQQARQHLQGRGFLGFSKRTETDGRNYVRSETTYLQDPAEYQAIGAPSLLQVRQNSGELILEVASTWNKVTYSSGTSARRFPYISSQVVKRYEVGNFYNGSLVSTATTSNTIDSTSGTVYDSTTATVEAATAHGLQPSASYTARIYHPQANLLNDTVNWCLGRPGQTQFINVHNQSGGTQITRTVNRTWDGLYCRETQEVIEPSDPQWRVTTDITYDDGSGETDPDIGNITKLTVTGVGMTPRTTSASWGADGRFLTSVTNALMQTATYAWDQAVGTLISITDPNSLATSWEYDAFGRRTKETRADGTITTYDERPCDFCGVAKRHLVEQVGTSNNAFENQVNEYYFDAFNRPVGEHRATLDGVSVTQRDYDFFGRVTNEYFPGLVYGSTTFNYDLLNRVIQTSRPTSDSDATPVITSAIYEGLTTRSLNELGRESVRVANVAGGMIRSTDPWGYYQSFEFDAFGNLVRVTDSDTNTLQSTTYNVRGMPTVQSDMDMGSNWTFLPNALGEVEKIRDANTLAPNWTTIIGYDALGRMTSRQDVAEGVTSTFRWGVLSDNSPSHKYVGHLKSISMTSGYSETYTLDDLARPQNTQIVSDATYNFDYTYNTEGQLDTLTYPTSTSSYRLKLQYEYRYRLLLQVSNFSPAYPSFWKSMATDDAGNYIHERLGDLLDTTRGIDRVTGLVDSINSATDWQNPYQDIAYTWDKVGNLTQRQDLRQNLTERFVYDELNRLDYSTFNGTPNLDLAYDDLGNIISKTSATDPSINVGSYTYHAAKKHAVTLAGG
ncbi:MAG TPA: FG-GAP-like repeat-containing protein, partial [Steroidobacteraceae bacterium]|nr:FG-GAP-like repeat-containing protein [Steroidobacteraceae bacterium]